MVISLQKNDKKKLLSHKYAKVSVTALTTVCHCQCLNCTFTSICHLPDVINCLFHVSCNTFGNCAFTADGPTVWNLLIVICRIQLFSRNIYGWTLKHTVSPDLMEHWRIRGANVIAFYKLTFTYVHTKKY